MGNGCAAPEKTLAKKRALSPARARRPRAAGSPPTLTPASAGGIERRMTLPSEIESRWTSGVVLKRDLFSTVERGRFGTPAGEVEAVLRRIDEVPWWSFATGAPSLRARATSAHGRGHARHCAAALVQCTARAGARLDRRRCLSISPNRTASAGSSARPRPRCASCIAPGICHNDLAKEQNWLRGRDGQAYLTDFQLAARSRAVPGCSASPPTKICGTCSSTSGAMRPTRSPPRSGACSQRRAFRPAYGWRPARRSTTGITRGVLRFTDREGGGTPAGRRTRPGSQPASRRTRRCARPWWWHFPIAASGTGLYAFVEAEPGPDRGQPARIHRRGDFAQGGVKSPPRPPEHLQVIEELPRARLRRGAQ